MVYVCFRMRASKKEQAKGEGGMENASTPSSSAATTTTTTTTTTAVTDRADAVSHDRDDRERRRLKR